MNIGRQWADRLRLWAEGLERHYCRRAAELDVSFFTTMDRLSLPEALQGPFRPAPPGTRWGRKWEYGWFRARAAVPPELEGERIVLRLDVGEEMLVWVNGAEAGSIDKGRRTLTLSRAARPGGVYEIVAECYAGHGPRLEGGGPVAFGEIAVPEPPETQAVVGECSLCVWNEALFQAAMDYLTLYSLAKKLPEKSLRAMKVIEGLKRFTCIADLELPEPELTASVVEADKVLKPLLACKNGSTAPEYTVFGQSHLDMAWLWPVEETMRKTARTYSNQLALMEEYPDYHFLLCEPPILEYLKELYPGLYGRVLEKAAQGRFYPDGALWIEADMNIPSGESIIRQFVWGKRWFRENLGVDSRMAWMPDTFGFPACLPQIMKKCQVPWFATQKLLRQDPEAEPFPYNLFWWEGLDGSRVLAHVFKKNNAVFRPEELISRWEEDRNQQEGVDSLLFPYGYGDGGGGPTREMVEMELRCRDLEGAPRCRAEAPVKFFERAEQGEVEHTWCGELYLAWHRGTLTSQAETKRGIRKAEVALKRVEYAMALRLLDGKALDPRWKTALDGLWKTLLFDQFHDIAAGASIQRVHETAGWELEGVALRGEELLREMLGEPGDETVVYNHLGWERVWRGYHIPAQGSAVVDRSSCWAREELAQGRELSSEDGPCYELRNPHLVCRLNGMGELISLRLSGDPREFLSGPGNHLLLFKDVNTCYDAWELGSMYEKLPVPLEEAAEASLREEEGGVALVVRRRVHNSTLTQRIFLGHGARRLDFITELDWHERHKMLKAAFPVNSYATQAVQEIQFGYVARPTHRSRQSDRDKYEVCNHRYAALFDQGGGAAVLNDCKYGVNVTGGEIRLTLMKAPLVPDMTADQGLHRFTYAVCPFRGAFADSGVLRQAVELNEPPLLGCAGARIDAGAFFLPLCENILVDTVKPADTAEGAILVRAYEAMGKRTDAAFSLSERISRVDETDMLEENARTLDRDGTLRVPFGPFEIKTFLLYL